ncbi:MAG: signal peptidase I [Candidatus Taylorbacteria bacterium RIFCSPHIGHO2_01_FULL_51_15]|uniref:Signal peptidase I n=1 Tax=Candidatus Taylorbacteria bacterium RIFCSPHIGHO2_01_FULL_51_15 TaxID=1802304 RepID=A0A1G2M9D1_9BACT|nr:MAG: signal peptidase I [Candidatus Taylorbacteria bacterium RIFCSPHIGHO2_01_FULL_51_15]
MTILYHIGYGLFVGAIVVLAGLLASTLLPIPGNFQVKVVKSGSMEPTIHTGSLVVIKPQASYAEGDIITFGKDTKTEVPTTHRIVASRAEGGVLIFATKGDANEEQDSKEVRQGEVIGKVLLDVPFAGYLIDFARKPLGFALLIGIPALAVIGDEIVKIWREARRLREKKRTQ